MKSISHFSRRVDLLPRPSWKTTSLLGIRFFSDTFPQAIQAILQGGLIVFPSGPGLATDLSRDRDYQLALENADLVFADSGALVLLWRIFSGQKIPRYSGLRILSEILQHPIFCQKGAIFWVMPSIDQCHKNFIWLQKAIEVPISEEDFYCAPHYETGSIEDKELLEILKKKQPRFIVICIGGGVQERLGYFLRKNLPNPASILCTGAAIAFLSGIQVNIPSWADKIFLGWLLRCMEKPQIFISRYFRAIRLVKVLFLYWVCGAIPGELTSDKQNAPAYSN